MFGFGRLLQGRQTNTDSQNESNNNDNGADMRSPRYQNLREFTPAADVVDKFVKAASVNDRALLEKMLKQNQHIRNFIDSASETVKLSFDNNTF